MNNSKLIKIVPLAKRLGVPVQWIRSEVEGNRLPHINAGGVLLFNETAVREALTVRAMKGAAS